MDSQPPLSARTRQWRRIGGYFAPGLLVAAVGAGSLFAQRELGAPAWILPVGVTLALILSARPIVLWWKAFDEVAKEAHRESWFWGGSVGMMVSVVIAMTVQSYAGAIRAADPDPIKMFVAGAGAMFLPMILGYLAWWCGWWLKRR